MDFGTVILIVVVAVLPLAAALFVGAFGLLDQLGTGALATLDRPLSASGPLPGTRAAQVEREDEVRQLVQARHDRRVARGEAGIDVEREVARLLELDDAEPGGDTALREEVRQLVIARNERRLARGEAPLDVEAEVARQLHDIAG